MKKLIPIAFLFLFGYSFAQDYQPFLDTNKMWIEYHDNMVTSIDQDAWSKVYVNYLKHKEDSTYYLIRQQIQHKYWGGFGSNPGNPSNPYLIDYTVGDNDTIAELMEDTVLHNTHIISSNLNHFSNDLLFSFDLDVDDTTYFTFWENEGIKVDSTDELILYDGSSIKRYYMNNLDYENCYDDSSDYSWGTIYFDSRIGSTMSFLRPFQQIHLKSSNSNKECRRCYFENQQLLWGDSTECNIWQEHYETGFLNIKEETELSRISIYPNPTSSTLNISGEIKFQSYKILDIQGKVLDSGQINNGTLDVSKLKQGLYYLIIETKKGMVSKKFTKI